jgi:hypothetical protein
VNTWKLGATIAVLVLTAGSAAFAQSSGSATPYKGLFGGASDQRSVGTGLNQPHHELFLTATGAVAYDDDVYADVVNIGNRVVPPTSGYYPMLLAEADYMWQGRRVQIGATGSSTLRYYSDLQEVRTLSHTGGLGLSAQFARRTTLFANQTVAYSPSYLYTLFPSVSVPGPGEVPTPAPDYSAYDTESYTYRTTVSAGHGITRRGQLTGGMDYQYTDYSRETGFQRDLTSYGVNVRFTQNLTRNTATTFGYHYRSSDPYIGQGRQAIEHGVDIRVDLSRALSPTRRATFGFTLSPAAVDLPTAIESAEALEREFRLLGDAHFTYQFNRTWRAQASYSRTFESVPGLRQPVYADGFTAVIDGFLSYRWDVEASASFSDGESALVRSGSFGTYAGNVRVRYALSRAWALYGEYLYYYYNFRGTAELPLGVPPVFERNGARVGLTVWLPVRGK